MAEQAMAERWETSHAFNFHYFFLALCVFEKTSPKKKKKEKFGEIHMQLYRWLFSLKNKDKKHQAL